jgi:hypothetical protein
LLKVKNTVVLTHRIAELACADSVCKTSNVNAGAETKLPYAALYSDVHYMGLAGGRGMTLVLNHLVITVSSMTGKYIMSVMKIMVAIH